MENNKDNDRLFTTSHGGTVEERDGKLVFTSKPIFNKNHNLDVGDSPPQDWQIFPLNDATLARMIREETKFPPLNDEDIVYTKEQ